MESIIGRRVYDGSYHTWKFGTVISAVQNGNDINSNYPIEVLWDDGTREITMRYGVGLMTEDGETSDGALILPECVSIPCEMPLIPLELLNKMQENSPLLDSNPREETKYIPITGYIEIKSSK